MKRKAVSCLLVLAALITMTPTIPTLAAGNPDNTIPTTQDITTACSQTSMVNYEQASSFTVTIPKNIVLNSDKRAAYQVKVKGDVAGNEKITVVPDTEVKLTDSNRKDPITGTITQDKTEFSSAEISGGTDGAVTNGNIDATGLTSGDWSGNFEFAIDIGSYGTDINNLSYSDYQTYGIEETSNVVIPTYVTDVKGVKHKVTGVGTSDTKPSLIETIVLPDSVTIIGAESFYKWSKLKNIAIPDQVNTIENLAFYDCTSLTNITVPNQVSTIGKQAFSYCTSLTNITLPDQLSDIESQAFYNCTSLTNITIPDQVSVIESGIFRDCYKLESVTLPKNLTKIKNYAFYNCKSLTNITIPDQVSVINGFAFSYCTSLTNVTLPDQVSIIDLGAFSKCTSLSTVTYKGVSYNSKQALLAVLKSNNVTVDGNPFVGTGLKD